MGLSSPELGELAYKLALGGIDVIKDDHGLTDQCFAPFEERIFGQMMRLAGADAVIYPNFGGRFSFSQEECTSIVEGTQMDMGAVKSIFPAPGGSMNIDRIPEIHRVYGNDVMFLIGGGLCQHGPDIVENCQYFRSILSGAEWTHRLKKYIDVYFNPCYIVIN
jgi:ribulose 1,5-bisphosphate carboxylase large subunit-like protein